MNDIDTKLVLPGVNDESAKTTKDLLQQIATDCNGKAPFGCRSFLNSFKAVKCANYVFVCDHCLTTRETIEASSCKDQLAEVVAYVSKLAKEVSELKKEKQQEQAPARPAQNNIDTAPANPSNAWKNRERLNKIKQVNDSVTVCIKNDGAEINLRKMKEVVTSHSIQVSKTSVNQKTGDVYVQLPSNEQREKLVPLLSEEEAVQGNTIFNVKTKCPAITIRNVDEFVSDDDFIEKVRAQNPLIKEKLDNGSEFSIVFKKEHNVNYGKNGLVLDRVEKAFNIVARVSDDIREALKAANDKLYIGFTSHKVTDRFYVKSCAACHRFGHYHKDCTTTACCGYCGSESHESKHCPVHQDKLQANYKCVNCEDAGKKCDGHSSHWHKCPVYLEQQKKVMNNIPYYAKK